MARVSLTIVDSRMPNTHRRRDATVELSRVGVGGVYWAVVMPENDC